MKIEKYSEILNQNIYIDNEQGLISCEDGTEYSRSELKLLNDTGIDLKKAVHKVKKFFDGEVVENEEM